MRGGGIGAMGGSTPGGGLQREGDDAAASALRHLVSRALWASAFGALSLLLQAPEVFGL